MADTTSNVSRARRVGRVLGSSRTRALLAVGAVLGLGTVSTLAYWTDTATVASTSFTSGSMNLKVDGAEGNPTDYAWNTFTATDLAPGESVAGQFAVQNIGTVGFTYTATGTASGALAPNLRFSIVAGTSGVTNTGTAANGNRVGSCTGGTAQGGNLTLGASSQTVTTAAQTVAANGSQNFCVIVKLDSGYTVSATSSSASAKFLVNAKQLGAP